jgi:membrane protein DedA with SNARE-associated domain
MPYYAALATLGSVAGCLTLHHIASRGGEAFLRKRVSPKRLERGRALVQRYGLLAVLVPSLLPPPAPFKLFVLLAGAVGVPRARFALAVLLGRGIRYFGQGFLAVWYGEQAIAFLRTHGREVWIGLVLAILVSVVAFVLWRRFRGRTPAVA